MCRTTPFHEDTNLVKKSGFTQQNLIFRKVLFFIPTYGRWHFAPLQNGLLCEMPVYVNVDAFIFIGE